MLFIEHLDLVVIRATHSGGRDGDDVCIAISTSAGQAVDFLEGGWSGEWEVVVEDTHFGEDGDWEG